MNFCSTLMLGSLAVVGWAAEPPATVQHYTSVVRPDNRSGKLVRSMVSTSKPVAEKRSATGTSAAGPGNASLSADLSRVVERIAEEHSLPVELIHSVIQVESNYNPYAVSSKGALGIMQLIPETARRFGVKNVFDPVENIRGGAKYLRYLLDLFDGSYPLALAAYNAGEAAVARYGGIPPYPDTQNYVVMVQRRLELARKPDVKPPAASAPLPVVEAKNEGPAHIVEVVLPDGSVRYVTK